MNTKDYRLYGCHFTEKDFDYINSKLDKLKKTYKISNIEKYFYRIYIYDISSIQIMKVLKKLYTAYKKLSIFR